MGTKSHIIPVKWGATPMRHDEVCVYACVCVWRGGIIKEKQPRVCQDEENICWRIKNEIEEIWRRLRFQMRFLSQWVAPRDETGLAPPAGWLQSSGQRMGHTSSYFLHLPPTPVSPVMAALVSGLSSFISQQMEAQQPSPWSSAIHWVQVKHHLYQRELLCRSCVSFWDTKFGLHVWRCSVLSTLPGR